MDAQEPITEGTPGVPTIIRTEHFRPIKDLGPLWPLWFLWGSGGGYLFFFVAILSIEGEAWVGLVAFLMSLLMLASPALAYRYWPRRRKALRIDDEGVHEILSRGRRRTLRWRDIDSLETRNRRLPGWRIVPRGKGGSWIEFDVRLPDAHAVASLIHARLHGLPLLRPADLPAPVDEDIRTVFEDPRHLQWSNHAWSWIMGLGVGFFALLGLGITAVAVWVGLPLVLIGMVAAVVGSLYIPHRWAVDEEGIQVHSLTQLLKQIRWQEVTGYDHWTIKGVHGELPLPPQGAFFRARLMRLIERLEERRSDLGGVRLMELPSAAALMLSSPEESTNPSPAALTEAKEEGEKDRLTGKELETHEKALSIDRQED